MKYLLAICLTMFALPGLSAPKSELWSHWQPRTPAIKTGIDHSAWDAFLQRYVDTSSEPYRVNYGGVSADDRASLKAYIKALEKVTPQPLTRDEQMAYWINLYNAATIDLILDNYPVKSITKIKSGFFSFGPWDRKLLKVDGKELSLNDIEHRILRPIFADPRVHYAVNCASIGCPDLAAKAYTGGNLEAMLEAGARRYVNSPRGVWIEDGTLTASSIYEWFKEDFGGNDASVIEHFRQYADMELKQQLDRRSKIDDDRYDWNLNDTP